MMCRTIVLYVAVQSVFVVALPTVNPYGGATGPFYHPTTASRLRSGIPDLGRLPKTTGILPKKLPTIATNKLIPGNSHLRSGRNPVIDGYQSSRIRTNRIQDTFQKPLSQMSEEERAEKVNSDLEKMIQFMTVLGQVDRYLSSRAKSFVSTLGRAMEDSPDDHQLYKDKGPLSYDY